MERCRLSLARQQLQRQLEGFEGFLGLQQQQRGDRLQARFKLDPGEAGLVRAALVRGGLQLPLMEPAALLVHEKSTAGPQKFGASIQCVQRVAFGWWVPQTPNESLLNLRPVDPWLDPKQAKVIKR